MKILEQALIKSLYKLLALGLDHSPKADELSLNVASILETLIKRGLTDRDDERLTEALSQFAINENRWPTPAMIFKYMPKKDRSGFHCAVCGETENLHMCGPDGERYYLCTKDLTSSSLTNERYYRTLHIVNDYVAEYQKLHPEATKKDACMEYMREKGLQAPEGLR